MHIYNANHTYIKSFVSQGNRNGQFQKPYCVCITRDGNVIVSDRGNHRIQVFTADGEHLHSFGSRGSGDDQFNGPEGVIVDKNGNLYVCEYGNNRVQKFDSQYKYICSVNNDSKLSRPIGICITDDEPFGKVIVSKYHVGRISVFNQ